MAFGGRAALTLTANVNNKTEKSVAAILNFMAPSISRYGPLRGQRQTQPTGGPGLTPGNLNRPGVDLRGRSKGKPRRSGARGLCIIRKRRTTPK